MLKDAPTPFGTYTPDNFDKLFAGPLSATDALVLSRNIPAIDLASQLENGGLYSFLQKAGVPLNADPLHYGLSIVLGSAEVTMTELVGLYASLNNKGVHQKVRTSKVAPDKLEQILTPESAFLTLDMLAHNQQPNMEQLNRLRLKPQSVAWKTGTSVGYRDAWAVGVFDHYVIGVWVGNFSGVGNTEFVGRKAAGPLLFNLIDSFAKIKKLDLSPKDPPLDLNLSSVSFCSRSGFLPNSNCNHRNHGWFIPGVSPIQNCSIHRKISVDPVSGLQVCPKFSGSRKKEIHEFWPSDILKLYEEAGIGRKRPPELHPVCKRICVR